MLFYKLVLLHLFCPGFSLIKCNFSALPLGSEGALHFLCSQRFPRCIQMYSQEPLVGSSPNFSAQTMSSSDSMKLEFSSQRLQHEVPRLLYDPNIPQPDTCTTALRALNHSGIHLCVNSFWLPRAYLHRQHTAMILGTQSCINRSDVLSKINYVFVCSSVSIEHEE